MPVEALRWLGLEDKVSLLKIGTPYPLPEKLVKQLLISVPEVLVIEELEPFVENHVKVIAQEAGYHGQNSRQGSGARSGWSCPPAKLPRPSLKLTGVKTPGRFRRDRQAGRRSRRDTAPEAADAVRRLSAPGFFLCH